MNFKHPFLSESFYEPMTLNSVLFTSNVRRKTCCIDHQTNEALNNWSKNTDALTDLPMKKRNLQFQMSANSVTAISTKPQEKFFLQFLWQNRNYV